MLEYFVMLLRRYKIPVRQYVIYIGSGIPSMPDYLRSGPLSFSYSLISISTVDYKLFLGSEKPEEKILAILGDFGGGDPKKVIGDIAEQVVAISEGSLQRDRHLEQLRILAQLRKFTTENLIVMDSLAHLIKEENDILYRRGEVKGKTEVIKGLLASKKFTMAEIAKFAGVTEAFVRSVKKTIK